ncbi:hypothetical protein [Bradyrhizobium lablabi]|nr:hypothetical protein [Bradyrhizobium lablabi]
MTFLSKFSGQFKERVWPSLLLIKDDAPPSYRTAEAVTAFRDIVSVSIVPYARSSRLRYQRANGLAFSNAFQFYPWMIDRSYEGIHMVNPAVSHGHVLEEFKGQCFPEQPQATINEPDIDEPLARELLNRWVIRFSDDQPKWKDKALFRALNMANEAGRIPAMTAAVFYDTGRSLALWVSAFEIVAHPGSTGQSDFGTVSALLESVKWLNQKLAEPAHTILGKAPQQKQLATWICRKVYDLRNDFLHGNDVEGNALMLNQNPIIDYAACLFRLVLTGFLGLEFTVPSPKTRESEAIARFINQRSYFNRFQRAYEEALLTAVEVQMRRR